MSIATPFEKIKAYHCIKPFLTEEQRNQVSSMLGLSEVDIKKRLLGKDNEVEFVLMIYLLEWCKSIVGFEEGSAKLTKTVAADLLIELQTGEKIVVEIKSKEENKFNISEKILKQKIEFAEGLGAKLFFAIKIRGYWMLFDSDYIESQNRKITIEKDFLNSQFYDIFGDRSLMFPKGLTIKSIYSKSLKEHMGITHPDYGNLVAYEIEYNKRNILEVRSLKDKDFWLVFVFECLQDIASNQSQSIEKLEADRTLIVETLTEEISLLNLSQFILSPIKHMMSELGHVYDFNEYLMKLIENETNFITRKHILYGISLLAENDYPILEKRGEELYLFKDMIINNTGYVESND